MTKQLDKLDEILEECVNTIGVAHYLLYHSDEEKKRLQDSAIPHAKQAIQTLIGEAVNKNNIDIVSGFDFLADGEVYSVLELKKVRPETATLPQLSKEVKK